MAGIRSKPHFLSTRRGRALPDDQRLPFDGAGVNCTGGGGAGLAGRRAAVEECEAAFGAAFGAAFAWDAAAGRGTGEGVAVVLGADEVADGSGVMMLTGGIEADDGNSASVGLPVGTDGGSPVNAAAAAAFAGAAESVAAATLLQAGV